VTALTAEFRRRRELLLSQEILPAIDEEPEIPVTPEDNTLVVVPEVQRIRKSPVESAHLSVVRTLDSRGICMNKWHECPDPTNDGVYDDPGFDGLPSDDHEIPDYDDVRRGGGKAGKRRKNQYKDKAAGKRNPFMSLFEVTRIEPKSEYVQQCSRLAELHRRSDRDLNTIWRGLVSRYDLTQPWDQAYQNGVVIAFNRARGGGRRQIGN
jgi:hypothetical protein